MAIDYYTYAKTSVFWDVEDFPVPEGRTIREIIESVLSRNGYNGEVSTIKAYGESETNPFPPEENLDGEFTYVHKRDKYRSLSKMLVDIGFWALDNSEPHYIPTNLMVVAQNMKQETEFVHLLYNLKSNLFNVLLVVPDLCQPEEVSLPNVSFVWRWKSLLEGGEPIPKDEFRALLDRVRLGEDDLALMKREITEPIMDGPIDYDD